MDKIEQAETVKNSGTVKRTPYSRRCQLLPIGESKFISIRMVRKKPSVNLRSYHRDEFGRLISTRRGIVLSADDWIDLKKHMNEVDNRLKSSNSRVSPLPTSTPLTSSSSPPPATLRETTRPTLTRQNAVVGYACVPEAVSPLLKQTN